MGRNNRIADNSDDEDKIAELENALAEAEEEIGALQLKLVDLEEMTASEQKLKARVKDAEENSRCIGDELDSQRRAVSMAESEKIDLMEAVATRDTEIEALQAEISKLVLGREELARGRLELEIRCVQLEEEKDRWEEDKLKFLQEIEEIKMKSEADLLPLKELKVKHSELMAEHEKFSKEHAAAIERSKLYDKDMLDKTKKIKEQAIDLKTLENLLHEKTKEISYQLSEVDLREKELLKSKETIVNFENVISKKESELTELKNILDESEEHSNLIQMKERINELEKDLTILIEDRNSLEKDVGERNNHVESLRETFEHQKEELNNLLEQKKKLDVSKKANEELSNLNDTIEQKLEEGKTKLQATEALLEDQRTKFKELKESLESKAVQLNQASDIKLRSQLDEIESLKKSICGYEESANQHINEKKKLTEELLIKNEETRSLESSVEMKSEEIKTMNEEVMSKYK